MKTLKIIFIVSSIFAFLGYLLKLYDYKRNQNIKLNFAEKSAKSIASNTLLILSIIGYMDTYQRMVDLEVLQSNFLISPLFKFLVLPVILIFLIGICVNYFAYHQARN